MSIPNVIQVRGNFYYRAKVSGQSVRRRLPSPGARNFDRAYERAKQEIARLRLGTTIADLIDHYQRSVSYRQLAPATQRTKDHSFAIISAHYGAIDVSDFARSDAYALQEAMSETPGSANATIGHLCTLLNFAVDRQLAVENVAANIKRLKQGGHKPWPSSLLNAAVEKADPMLRLAIITGLESAQRISDVIKITHEQVETGLVELVQQKTQTRVFVPVTDEWRRAIAEVPKRTPTLLYTEHGRPFKSPGTIQTRIKCLVRALGYPEHSFHGLRRNATNRLAERGLSPFQIKAITGMTLPTVMHYTKDVNSRSLALSTLI